MFDVLLFIKPTILFNTKDWRIDMPTPASQMALDGLRDLSTLKWYVIPLLAFVFYMYATEIKKARQSGKWNADLKKWSQ